ncbi:ATP-binding cassette sub-family C member 3-like isoform X2 [Corticium candelabrum]|nr:ATP-binding cassette sub-family C member 3-like isoform X2 [Corticium candelabrum]
MLSLSEDTDTDDASIVQDTSMLLPESNSNTQAKAKKPSLLLALTRAFGKEITVEMILKLIQDLIMFVGPLLLKLLIDFTEDSTIPTWRGYVYASLLFIVAEVQSLDLHQYFQRCNKTGFHIRTAVMDVLYRKSLKLNNNARRKTTVGEIVNLMSVDAQRFFDLMLYGHMIWSAPVQIILATVFLWQVLGPSVLAGIAVVILIIPISSAIAAAMRKMQVKQMELKDKRIKVLNEIFSGIKVIKLYAWEKSFLSVITNIRHQELHYLRKAAYLTVISMVTSMSSPFLVSVAAFATYSLSGNDLTPQKAFVALSLFNILRFPLSMLPTVLSRLVQTYVSLRRVTNFLQCDELDTSTVRRMEIPDTEASVDSIAVVVSNGTFRWEKGRQIILESINLRIKKGSLVSIVGIVGSGKSSILSAILGEMEADCGRVILQGCVAYVSQVAWIQNATVQDNVLFGNELNQEWYEQVLEACALNPDLELLPAGDMTEIGEKGINLSGGQKQRVALARAVYSYADIYLLDDPLSAVDAHVGEHIFNKVIGPTGILRNKARILVTHGVSFLPQVDQILVMTNGYISETGTYNELLQQDGAFADFLKTHTGVGSNNNKLQESIEKEKCNESKSYQKNVVKQINDDDWQDERKKNTSTTCKEKTASRRGSRIIREEETETGMVKLGVYAVYAKSIGVIVSICIVLGHVGVYGFSVGASIWLSDWSDAEAAALKQNHSLLHSTSFYLGIYSSFCVGLSIMMFVSVLAVAYGTLNAARLLHKHLLKQVLRCPMSFFDTTPIGRIVNRFSKDMYIIDERIPESTRGFLYVFFGIVSTIVVVSYSTPIFLSTVIPIGVLFIVTQRFYVATSRQLMRLESITRSPIFSHFQETLNGTSTIRAFGQEQRFINDSQHHMDQNMKAYYPYVTSYRWLAIRLEFIGNTIVFFTALFAVIERGSLSAGIVGLSISYSLRTTQMLTWLVRMMGEMETRIVSVERVKEYSEVATEAPSRVENNSLLHDWPTAGRICFNSYSVRYREGLDVVLNDINCCIEGCEKIGIVGRTGAGKSSLTMALFRILEAAGGSITIDGVDIATIGLEDLRSRITVIPQDPVLFSGTLRYNVDPFGQATDAEIWSCLARAHLRDFVESLGDGLSSEVAEGGDNLSVGQRQLVCLARALLRKSKILVLDEATAAVDLETDSLIQQTIREAFADCTVLTIAHRLNTIMDSDRVIVLDNGQIVEFDSPAVLLSLGGAFQSMAASAGIL